MTTTEDKEIIEDNEEDKKEDETVSGEDTKVKETPITMEMLNKLMDEKLKEMSNKLSDLQKKYDDDTKKLKADLEQKEKEVDEQKKLTANLLLNSSGGTQSEEIDFKSVDFDDVDWDKQAQEYLAEMDKRLFNTL